MYAGTSARLSALGTLLLPAYLLTAVLLGVLSRRTAGRGGNLLTASRSVPLPLVVLAYVAANCGALEIVGMAAVGAQYGLQAFHFYWIGALPALVFLSLWMMPVYRRSEIRTLPEYLRLRFGGTLQQVNAYMLLVLLPLLAAISLYALAQVLVAMFGMPYTAGMLLSLAVALAYVLLGGVRANIANEVLQLGVVLAGVVPLAWRSFTLARPEFASQHLWRGLPMVQPHATTDVLGVGLGLGFVLGFGYWCTDFVLMQRALTARTEAAARQVPLWAGLCKLLLGFVFIVPGLAAGHVPGLLGKQPRFDTVLPMMMRHLYGPTLLGLGFTALAASLLSGVAANITAAATVFTEDVYRTRLWAHGSEPHYRRVGRWAAVAAGGVSAVASTMSFHFGNVMEHVQVLYSIGTSPFAAIFMLGVVTRRATGRGALAGFLAGCGAGLVHLAAVRLGMLHYGSTLAASFYGAILSFGTATLVCLVVSRAQATPASATLLDMHKWPAGRRNWGLLACAALLLALCVGLNVWLR